MRKIKKETCRIHELNIEVKPLSQDDTKKNLFHRVLLTDKKN